MDFKWLYDLNPNFRKTDLISKICIRVIIVYVDLRVYSASFATEFINDFI